jgi:hypothetical protein
MTTSIVECPHCHYRFNYEFIPGASFTSICLGSARIFKCPNCKEPHKFYINHFGADPSLPTHGDNSETSIGGKNVASAAGPLIVLVAIGFLLVATGTVHSALVVIILSVIGIVWILAYIAYLYRKATRNTNGIVNKAK